MRMRTRTLCRWRRTRWTSTSLKRWTRTVSRKMKQSIRCHQRWATNRPCRMDLGRTSLLRVRARRARRVLIVASIIKLDRPTIIIFSRTRKRLMFVQHQTVARALWLEPVCVVISERVIVTTLSWSMLVMRTAPLDRSSDEPEAELVNGRFFFPGRGRVQIRLSLLLCVFECLSDCVGGSCCSSLMNFISDLEMNFSEWFSCGGECVSKLRFSWSWQALIGFGTSSLWTDCFSGMYITPFFCSKVTFPLF